MRVRRCCRCRAIKNAKEFATLDVCALCLRSTLGLNSERNDNKPADKGASLRTTGPAKALETAGTSQKRACSSKEIRKLDGCCVLTVEDGLVTGLVSHSMDPLEITAERLPKGNPKKSAKEGKAKTVVGNEKVVGQGKRRRGGAEPVGVPKNPDAGGGGGSYAKPSVKKRSRLDVDSMIKRDLGAMHDEFTAAEGLLACCDAALLNGLHKGDRNPECVGIGIEPTGNGGGDLHCGISEEEAATIGVLCSLNAESSCGAFEWKSNIEGHEESKGGGGGGVVRTCRKCGKKKPENEFVQTTRVGWYVCLICHAGALKKAKKKAENKLGGGGRLGKGSGGKGMDEFEFHCNLPDTNRPNQRWRKLSVILKDIKATGQKFKFVPKVQPTVNGVLNRDVWGSCREAADGRGKKKSVFQGKKTGEGGKESGVKSVKIGKSDKANRSNVPPSKKDDSKKDANKTEGLCVPFVEPTIKDKLKLRISRSNKKVLSKAKGGLDKAKQPSACNRASAVTSFHPASLEAEGKLPMKGDSSPLDRPRKKQKTKSMQPDNVQPSIIALSNEMGVPHVQIRVQQKKGQPHASSSKGLIRLNDIQAPKCSTAKAGVSHQHVIDRARRRPRKGSQPVRFGHKENNAAEKKKVSEPARPKVRVEGGRVEVWANVPWSIPKYVQQKVEVFSEEDIQGAVSAVGLLGLVRSLLH